jgi:hypothetical protein
VGAGSSNLRLKVSCTLFDTLSLNCKGNGQKGVRATVFTTPGSLVYSQHCIPPHPRPSSTAYLIKEALGHVLGDHCRLLRLTELSLREGMINTYQPFSLLPVVWSCLFPSVLAPPTETISLALSTSIIFHTPCPEEVCTIS